MIQTTEIESFIDCNYKAFLLKDNAIEIAMNDSIFLEKQIKEDLISQYLKSHSINEISDIDLLTLKNHSEIQYFTNSFYSNEEFNLNFYLIKKEKKELTPFEITIFENPTKEEKLKAGFKAFLLKKQINIDVKEILFIKSKYLKTSKFKINSLLKDYKQILDGIRDLKDGKLNPKPSIKSHCQICQFETYCRKQLMEKEDLSLLSGLSFKEVLKKNAKGIFSITQLAYLFSPSKKLYSKKKFLPELKAFAIREKKTFIVKSPELPTSKTEIFLDIEGTPDNKNYYLIGAIIKQENITQIISYWENNNSNSIFLQFLDYIADFEDFKIYHYGTYEANALKYISKIVENTKYEAILKKAIANSYNILNEFLERVYPPTYTNSLKNIAQFLGFEWKEPDINGYKSIFWRKKWELDQNSLIKQKLINYNLEDCHALLIVKNWLCDISAVKNSNENISQVADIKQQSLYKFGKTGYIIPEFEKINDYAYFDYQRDKVYLKTHPNIKKKLILTKNKKKITPNEVIYAVRPKNCPHCGESKYYKNRKSKFKKVLDLKFGKNSIKKWIIFYENEQIRCTSCKKAFSNKEFLKNISPYKWNLQIWCINQIIYNVSVRNISKLLKEYFNILIPHAIIVSFKSFLANYYSRVIDKIKRIIISGNLIQIDETQVYVKDIKSKCYVWVFATIDSVFYLFRENRETDFLKEMLVDFKGVLISDFYTGYDAMDCSQQKCLVHLMRDLNDDLLKNPFNKEYQFIVNGFATLLQKITNTVNKYGLKHYYLKKHKKDVEVYFKEIFSQKFETEIAIFYQKKFKKYKDKLFCFLDYDGIPWNNNNAEVAIKPFAIHRKLMQSLHSKQGIEEYLILLSIQQTCKYRNLSFFEFLKSGKLEL
jgi:predicted RecB family nuclease